MSNSLKDALKGAGVSRDVVAHVPRNKAEWLAVHGLTEKQPQHRQNTGKPHTPLKPQVSGEKYIVLPFAKLHSGSIFVPIEKMGKTFYYNRTTEQQVTLPDGTITVVDDVEHLSERKWAITRDLFIKDSNARSMSLTTGRDAIFALTDWAIIKVS